MPTDDLSLVSRRERRRMVVLAVLLVSAALTISLYWLRSAPPRQIVLASGPEFGVYHQHALRYQKILAREGVKVVERMTSGAEENLKLLLDPRSGVDVAFMQGGVAAAPAADDIVMLASLYSEPVWIFYRGPDALTRIKQLQGRRLAGWISRLSSQHGVRVESATITGSSNPGIVNATVQLRAR